ncbi:hypothetical protein ACVWXL_004675 [Bradyrhizobium sp. GM22.5]|nr:IS4 family transposase [Bradyrhizobium sp. 174]
MSCSARPGKLERIFVIRTCVDRLAGDGNHTIADEMDEVAVKGLHRINVRNNNGDPDEAILEIRYRKLRVLPPIGKQKRYPALTLTVIHAEERMTPKNRKKIEWKLITNLPVSSRTEAIEKLEWYALRWKIEVFHKILKSRCKAEESKLRTAQRLTNLISLFCILSWRVFWMTMLNRSAPNAPPIRTLTATEIGVLDRLVKDRPKARRKTLSHYLIKVARLGGYLARASDPPPGNTVMWRGLSRLTDIALGVMLSCRSAHLQSSLAGELRQTCAVELGVRFYSAGVSRDSSLRYCAGAQGGAERSAYGSSSSTRYARTNASSVCACSAASR